MDVAAPEPADFARYRVEPDERFSLSDHAPADTDGLYAEPQLRGSRACSPARCSDWPALAGAAGGRQAVR